MTAQPSHDYGPDDPVEILHVLPARFHEQFLAEYAETGPRYYSPGFMILATG